MSSTTAMAPVQPGARIDVLDVLRGAALFGILAANMRAFNSPLAAYFDRTLMWTAPVDKIAQGLIDTFISGKFITLFSFMFGIGFAIQMHRASDRGVDPKSFYLRRLSVLLIFGLVHGLLLWWGDILMPYALMGFGLYALRNKSDKTLLKWAALLYAWPLVPALAGTIALSLGAHIPTMPRTTPEALRHSIEVFSAGSYLQIVREQFGGFVFNLVGLVFYYPRILGLFVFGLWVYRRGIVSNLAVHSALLRKCQRWGFAIGLPGNIAFTVLTEILHPNPMGFEWQGLLVALIATVAIPAMSLFYASTLVLLYQNDAWKRRLHPFGAVGRTALTNYLLQTVICTTLYYSWGLVLYGRVDPLLGLIPTFVIYALQVVASVWYLRHFAFGPMEWLWRRLTYGTVRERYEAASSARAN